MLFVTGSPPDTPRMGAVSSIEDGQWLVSLGGLLGDYPPDDEAGFHEYARGLPTRELYDAIAGAEPLGNIAVHRFPSHLWRRYERMKRIPEGFVAMGDSLCSFNPIYGQGMTVAALSALVLDERLRAARRDNGPADVRGVARSFHARAAKVVHGPWAAATGQDFRYPAVEGKRPPGFALSRWYLDRIQELVLEDPDVVLRYYRVMHLLAPPRELYRPAVLARVLVHAAQKALHLRRPRLVEARGLP
jgi:2-polyprenyl-6-methoxyphenol hydroxylase-like FAD-dependent oxidoreductase